MLPLFAISQKIALFDTKFTQPIIFTDSVTLEQITKGYFPVEVNNFDTLYANLNYIKNMLSKRQRAKMKSFELRAGNTILTISRVPFAYGDRYSTIAKTKIKELESDYVLTDFNKKNSDNLFKIERLMSYMKNNKELFKAPNEITPKIYNVVTITE
jgi:hypothetical protein